MSTLANRTRWLLALLWRMRGLPPRVGLFYLRALWAARRAGDRWSIISAAKPGELATLVGLAGGCERVVEVGTGTAWTSIALALGDRRREVVTYDPVVRPHRDVYLRLAPSETRQRIRLVRDTEELGPAQVRPVDLVFIDSSHEREETIATFEDWRGALAPGGVVVFHDYGEPTFPGVQEAVRAMSLDGEVRGSLFIWRNPA